MKKVDDKQVFGLVVALCALALVAGYFLLYKKWVEEKESLERSNASLRSRIESLKEYYDNEEYYRMATEDMLADLQGMISDFRSDVREEDTIVHGIQMQQNSSDLELSQISIAGQEEVKRISYADFVEPVGVEEFDGDIVFQSRTATYSTSVSYSGLKDTVAEILDSDYQLGISVLSFSGEPESELLLGSMALRFYSITGAGLDYQEPDVASYLTGMNDIFGFHD